MLLFNPSPLLQYQVTTIISSVAPNHLIPVLNTSYPLLPSEVHLPVIFLTIMMMMMIVIVIVIIMIQ